MGNSPVYSSKSDGLIERTIQSVQGLVKTWRSSREAKWGVKLDLEHRIWPWLVEMVGWMMSRADVGADGMTGYERCKGRRARLPGMERRSCGKGGEKADHEGNCYACGRMEFSSA